MDWFRWWLKSYSVCVLFFDCDLKNEVYFSFNLILFRKILMCVCGLRPCVEGQPVWLLCYRVYFKYFLIWQNKSMGQLYCSLTLCVCDKITAIQTWLLVTSTVGSSLHTHHQFLQSSLMQTGRFTFTGEITDLKRGSRIKSVSHLIIRSTGGPKNDICNIQPI